MGELVIVPDQHRYQQSLSHFAGCLLSALSGYAFIYATWFSCAEDMIGRSRNSGNFGNSRCVDMHEYDQADEAVDLVSS